MIQNKITSLFGLKWNPFIPEVPPEALQSSQNFQNFCYRVESLALEGGFASITGDPGLGKSVALRMLSDHLSQMREIIVGEFTRPQSATIDFYRELGSIFGVDFRVTNRFTGYKELRSKWQSHIESTLIRPVLLIDEAQEMFPNVLSELRMMGSSKFDSIPLITVVLAGDLRLTEKLKLPELIPLGSRIRVRYHLEMLSKSSSISLLKESMNRAGNSSLMTQELIETLAEHSLGNPRVCMNMASQILALGAQLETQTLDIKLFFDLYQKVQPPKPNRKN